MHTRCFSWLLTRSCQLLKKLSNTLAGLFQRGPEGRVGADGGIAMDDAAADAVYGTGQFVGEVQSFGEVNVMVGELGAGEEVVEYVADGEGAVDHEFKLDGVAEVKAKRACKIAVASAIEVAVEDLCEFAGGGGVDSP